MVDEPIATMQKAFSFNMDKDKYGTIAEIGAGQEHAEHRTTGARTGAGRAARAVPSAG